MSPLTKAELLTAAERADKYPPGNGSTFFAGQNVGSVLDAGWMIEKAQDKPLKLAALLETG